MVPAFGVLLILLGAMMYHIALGDTSYDLKTVGDVWKAMLDAINGPLGATQP